MGQVLIQRGAGGGGGGGGAPTDAQYVVLATNGTLTGERVLTPADFLDAADGGAGGNLTLSARAQTNYLINGGFDFAQRQAPATSTNFNDADYGPDRWKLIGASGSPPHQWRRYKRGDAGSDFTGLTSQSYGRYTKVNATDRGGLLQIVEACNTYPLVGRTVRFQVQLRANTNTTWKIGLLEWQGTEDAPTNDPVSAWGDPPTWAASYSLLASASCAVTTSFGPFSVTGAPSASCKNLIVVLWSSGTLGSGSGTLELAEAGLYDGSAARPWLPRPAAEELVLCQRYYEKTYDLDTAPGTATGNGAGFFSSNRTIGNGDECIGVSFKVAKRAVPTVTIYSTASGASAKYRNGSAGADRSAIGGNAGHAGCRLIHNEATTTTDTQACYYHWTSAAEL